MSRDITELAPVRADKRIAYGDDPNQFFDLFRAKHARGAAVMIHGGFWRARYDLQHASHLCAALARAGIATASLEYRRVGNPGGGWPGTFDDILAGFHAAVTHLGSAKTICLGHSAGGHLALRLAAEDVPLSGVVALAPVADLRVAHSLNLSNGAVVEFLGGVPATHAYAYDAACPSVHPSSVRRILVHGTADDIVPLNLSVRYVQARAMDAGVATLTALPGVDHFALIDPQSAAWPAVLSAAEETLL